MIAFIVVASVAAMATLNTGIFGAEETRGTVFGALDKASGSIVFRGGATAERGGVDVDGDDTLVITSTSTDQHAVVKVKFVVTGSTGDSSIDLTPPHTSDSAGTDPDASGLTARSVMRFVTEDVIINDAAWTVDFLGSSDGDYMLEEREKAEITLWLQQEDLTNSLWDLGSGSGDPFIDAAGELLQTKTPFSIEFDVGGSVIAFTRTSPSSLDPVMHLP